MGRCLTFFFDFGVHRKIYAVKIPGLAAPLYFRYPGARHFCIDAGETDA